MQKRRLGASGLELTTVGFGAWAIGGGGWAFGWGPQDDTDSILAIRHALDRGVNWIDTAAAYGLGHSEEVVGRAIQGRRDSVYLATKCGLVWDPGTTTPYGRLKASSVRREAEESLRRLRTDRIDLYQIHWPDPEADIEEAWSEIARMVGEGKIRFAGVSNFDTAQIDRVRAIHPVASLQPPYSMLRRGVEKELLAYCAKQGIGVVAYSPMQAGLLTGGITRERMAALPEEDWRRKSREFNDPNLTANLELVESLKALAARHGRTVAQLAIAWVLRRSEVTAAIVGARSPKQIEETAGAADWRLPVPLVDQVESLLAQRERRLAA